MKIKANIGFILTIVTALLVFFLIGSLRNTSLFIIIIICYLDIWLFKIFFEYQQITLTLARIACISGSTLSIVEMQIMMANSVFSFLLFFSSFLTGLVFGILLLKSFIFLLGFVVLKYFLNTLIPACIPYKLLFKLIEEELNKISPKNVNLYISRIRINKYFEEMPHNKDYENWAFRKYGNDLLKIQVR